LKIQNNTSSFNNHFLSFFNNLNYQDKQIIRKALSSLPDELIPKALKALNQVPPDKDYLQKLLSIIEEFKPSQGFSIYA